MSCENVGRVTNLCYRETNIHWFSSLNHGMTESLICELCNTTGALGNFNEEIRVFYVDNTYMPSILEHRVTVTLLYDVHAVQELHFFV
jgi:hypothetical protein